MKIIESHIVPAIKEKIRLQEYAICIFSSISTKSGLKKAVKKQEILLNGFPAKTSDWIEEHQKIDLLQPEISKKKIFNFRLKIIYEDNFLAVINKPSGIPTNGNYFKTVENALPFNLAPSSELDALPFPMPVHRLDNPTSGLLLIAKTRKTQILLNRGFQNRLIQKTYYTIVVGHHGEYANYTDEIENKPARSEVKLLKLITKVGKKFSLLEVSPNTGRTHQIRLHLSSNGFPIVGDMQFGDNTLRTKGMYLVAAGLCFNHPITAEPLKFEISLPRRFREF